MISLVAAMANNRVIGLEGDMPWHMPADLAHFKQTTLGKTVLMGRKTFDSLGRPLPKRRNVVISRQTNLELSGCEVMSDLPAFLQQWHKGEDLMVIGGATIYEQAMPFADQMVLTFIEADLQGDTHFPIWVDSGWQEVARESHQADDKNPYNYQFVTFSRL